MHVKRIKASCQNVEQKKIYIFGKLLEVQAEQIYQIYIYIFIEKNK